MLEVLDEINRLLDLEDGETVNTSMRLPAALRDAAALAAERLGVAPTATALTVAALRQSVETASIRTALQAHYEQHPSARPSLAETARALAEQDGSPLAFRPDLLESAAQAVLVTHPNADGDDVLLWAEAQLAMRA